MTEILNFVSKAITFTRSVKATDVKHSVFLSSFDPKFSEVSPSFLKPARSHNPYTKSTSTARGKISPLEINLVELSFLLALEVT